MKKIIISSALLFSMYGNAQTGIGTASPKATLHVMGKPNVDNIVDGAILPNLTADQLKDKNSLYSQEQKGAIVYVTAAPSTAETESNSKTYYVNTPGYYYFDGTKWNNFVNNIKSWNLDGNDIDVQFSQEGKLISGDFIGSKNNKPLLFKANNEFIGYLKSGVVSLGKDAFQNSVADDVNVIAIGRNALKNNTGNNNIGIGTRALTLNTAGANNIAIGIGSLETSTTASQNTSVGSNSSKFLSGATSINNVAFGMSSLMHIHTGSNNVAIGARALMGLAVVNQGSNNVALGYEALYNPYKTISEEILGKDNIGIGTRAGMNVKGNRNIFIGHNVTLSTNALSDNSSHEVIKSNSMNIGNIIFGSDILKDNETYTTSVGKIGIGTHEPQARLHITANSLNSSNQPIRVSEPLKIDGLSTATTETVETLVVNSDGIVKKKAIVNNAMSAPKFFYMPSVVLPVTPAFVTTMANANITYNDNSSTYTVDLYELFKNQFNTPIKSSNGISSGLTEFVLPREAYEYHVIYADNNVFPHADIDFVTGTGNEGKLTYKVNSNAIVQNSSFMNIVLKVK